MNLRQGLALTLLISFLGGCGKQAPAPVAGDTKLSAKATPGPIDGAKMQATEKAVAEPTKQGDLAAIPESLKHEGYEYFGLGNGKPIDVELRIGSGSPAEQVSSGSVQTVFTGMKGGVAHFKTSRTGALEQFGGTEEVTCEPDGIYTISTSLGKIGSKHLELPAKLTPGATWSVKTTMTTSDGRNITGDDVFTAKGIKQVKTKAGDFEALVVESKGTAVIDGKKARTKTVSWYVRGKGQVRLEDAVTADGKTQTIILEESKSNPTK